MGSPNLHPSIGGRRAVVYLSSGRYEQFLLEGAPSPAAPESFAVRGRDSNAGADGKNRTL